VDELYPIFAMRAILTPLFIFTTLITWGQDFEHPALQIDELAMQQAYTIWQSQEPASISNEGMGVAMTALYINEARGNRASIFSVQPGIWTEPATWNCNCVPTLDDDVFVDHVVSMDSDVEFNSLYVRWTGSLLDLNDVTMTFDGNFVADVPVSLPGAILVANAIAGNQILDVQLVCDELIAKHRTTLTIKNTAQVTGNLGADDSTIDVHASGQLRLTENENGRATVMRTNGGAVLGLVTRHIVLPAVANRTTPIVQHRVSLGLEGVSVSELVGDFPTVGFVGADVEAGNANIAYWNADAFYNYQKVGSADDILPVWEGLYLSLAPGETYTLTYSGTMPSAEVSMEVPAGAFSGLFGNTTHGNYDLEQFDAQMGEDGFGLRCWNTNTLQWDIYVDGLSTNGMGTTLQPSVACEYSPADAAVGQAWSLNATNASPNGTFVTGTKEVAGSIIFAASNPSGFADECRAAIVEGTSVEFDAAEDGTNGTSPYSACDLYLRDVDNTKNGIVQLAFDREPMATFDLILAANAPFDGDFTLDVTEMNWPEGCVFIQLNGESEAQPLEVGELTQLVLSSSDNNTYTVGTLYLVPPVRAEVSSPGCEGSGETLIEVLPNGDGPWTVALNDHQGNNIDGVVDAEGVGVMFAGLESGTYTYTVMSTGSMTCGSTTGEHMVIKPTKMTFDMTVTNDCGEGGEAVAEITSDGTDLEYHWSDGQQGSVALGLEGGLYELIVTDAFECKDTVEVEILSAPALSMLATDGTCDGITDSAIELNSDDDSATWDVDIRDESGALVDFAYNVPTPLFFDMLVSGTYTVEVQVLGDYGCEPETREATVTQPVPMTLTVTSDTQCDEEALGTATASLIGGLGNVTYTWSDGSQGQEATALTAGTHTVTVTDEAGCEESAEVIVALTPHMEVTPMNPGCEGEGETGFAFSGQSDVTWTIEVTDADGNHVQTLTTPGGEAEIAGLASGAYTVTYSNDIEDGCPAKTLEAELTEASNLVVDATITPMECGDINTGAIDLTVHGGIGNVSVTWEHGTAGMSLTNLAGGQYYALVEDDNGCTKEVRVELEETPTLEARFDAPTGGLTDGNTGMTLAFTNTSEGNITGQTWYFGDTDVPSYDFHATHTFEEAGAYDVFLNVWNDKCSHTVRKTVVVSQGDSNPMDDDLGTMVTSVMEGNLTEIHAPITTETGWMMDLGAAAPGMKIHVFDLTGRQLCHPAAPDANGQIWVEGDQWPALVLLRLVHEPTNSIRTWKMVR